MRPLTLCNFWFQLNRIEASVNFGRKLIYLNLNSDNKEHIPIFRGNKNPFFLEITDYFFLHRWYENPNPKEWFFPRFDFSFLVMEEGRIDPIRSGIWSHQMHIGGHQEQFYDGWKIPNCKPQWGAASAWISQNYCSGNFLISEIQFLFVGFRC